MKMAHAACLFLVVGVVSTLFMSSNGATHSVGGSTGWTTPPNTSFYSDWASGYTFAVGDVLVFTFKSPHLVAQVDESDYTSCNTSSSIVFRASSPVSISLTTAGTHYYVCTVAGHCASGQKLAVTVTGNPPTSRSGATATVASFYLVCQFFVISLLVLML